MTTPQPAVPASITREIPAGARGTLCTCEQGRRPGPPHPAAYLLVNGTRVEVGCVAAAAAFAARHGLAFPLTSGGR